MHCRSFPLNRLVTVGVLVSTTMLGSTSCSLFRFGDYDRFDEWFASSGYHTNEEIPTIGIQGLEGTFTGYLVNDIVIRTPVFLVYDATWLLTGVVAIPYYTVTYFATLGERTPAGYVDLREIPPDSPAAPAEPEIPATLEKPAEPENTEGG